jgi:hypothetical protein
MNEPDAFLKQRFLKAGSWDREERQLRGITLKLVYPYDNGQLILSLEGSALVRQTGDQAEQVQGVLAHANFHRDCKGYPTDRLVLEHIAKATTDETHLGALLTELLSDVAE